MSAIFGILNQNGRRVRPDDLDRMKEAMACWGPDGSSTWVEASVGLGCLKLNNAPESLYDTLPLTDGTGTLTMTCNARLDNRKELFASLSIPNPEQARMPDSVLILKSYEKWGTACPRRLLGDWSFAIWDTGRQRLFVARDHFGKAGLYYYCGRGMFVFASSLKGILALAAVPRDLNPVALAQLSVFGKRDASTFYKGVFHLTPAQAMTVTSDKMDIQRYWHPQDIPQVCFRSDEEYAHAFLEIYRQAVRCRLRSSGPVGVLMSGGLDSGSVAALAASDLQQRNERLLAFSWRPTYDISDTVPPHRCGDETPFIKSICALAGNIDATFNNGTSVRPLPAIERALGILGQPDYIIAMFHWFMSLLDLAQKRNVGILLHGGWGNFTVSWPGNRDQYVFELLRSGQWQVLMKELSAWRKLHGGSVLGTTVSQVVKALLPDPWFRASRQSRLARAVIKRESARAALREYPAVTPEIETLRKRAPHPLRRIYNMYQSGNIGVPSELAAGFGLELRNPTIDKRVVEFCLGIPQDQYMRGTQQRLLIRRAMSGLMPDNVVWNTRRGRIAGDIWESCRAGRAEMAAVMRKLKRSPLARHWLELPLMERCFEELQVTDTPELGTLLKGLTVGSFLLNFEEG